MKQQPDDTDAAEAGGAAAAQPAEEGPRSFVNFLARMSEGEAESSLSYEMHELGKRLQEIAKMTMGKAKGKLKLVLSFVAEPSGAVGIAYKIDVTAPKTPTTPAVFWLTKGGNLSPTDTRQLELRPREVPSKREVREPKGAAQPREV